MSREQGSPEVTMSRDGDTVAHRKYRVIAIGESAGGFRSLCELLAPLPSDLNCAILVVQHLSPTHKSLMAELLRHKTALAVRQAQDGDPLSSGVVYVAPPDWHLLSEPDNVRLLRTPAVRFHRPSVDLLFESVAVSHGRHAIGVVLSGSGSDGATGIRAIKMAGGRTIVEDPGKAEFSSMPYAAIATGCVDTVLPLHEIGRTLVDLCSLKDE